MAKRCDLEIPAGRGNDVGLPWHVSGDLVVPGFDLTAFRMIRHSRVAAVRGRFPKVALAMGLLLSGCGGGTPSAPPTSNGSAPPPTTAPPQSAVAAAKAK